MVSPPPRPFPTQGFLHFPAHPSLACATLAQLGIIPYAGVDIAVFEMLKERLLDEYDGYPPAHMILGAGA